MPTLRAFLLMGASMTFVLGITLPLLRFDRLFVFSEAPSLIEIVRDLATGGEVGLAILVALVSIVFPLVKLATVHVLAIDARNDPPQWLAALSKWSMVDVILVALAIFAAKTSGVAGAMSQPGVWFYFLSAAMAYAASALTKRERVEALER